MVALSLAIVGVRFFGISRAICRYGERYVSHSMAFQGLYELRVAFFKRLEPLVPRIFQSLKMGDLLGRIMADIETLQFFYLRTVVPSLSFLGVTVKDNDFLTKSFHKAFDDLRSQRNFRH